MSASVELYPNPGSDRVEAETPVRTVTLLEDRAQVERRGRVSVKAGSNRLIVRGVAPVLQDVSLVATTEARGVKVADARVRRALRVRRATRPERARVLEQEIEDRSARIHDLARDRMRVEDRQRRTVEILLRSVTEIPVDAGWGLMNHQAWKDNLESLLARSKNLSLDSLATKHVQDDLREEVVRLIEERRAFDRPDFDLAAWIEIDLEAEQAGEAELTLAYVVPNALWRPIHSARLSGSEVAFSSRAAVWQNTGEDWKDVTLELSTARSSLGTEPPLLDDDLLAAQKKSPEVHVQARQVKIQKAGAGGEGGAPPPDTGVELPGVDDGGETRTLEARGPSTVPSDGRPVLLPLFDFASPASPELVLMPEIEPKVILKTTSTNKGTAPVLAGPVELVRDSGVVGWTKVPFVAPGERFELGFGPDEALRVVRTELDAAETDPVDRWQVGVRVVQVYLSNLSTDAKMVLVTERIPVSELREVEVTLLADRTTKGVSADRDGLCRWTLEVPPRGRKKLRLSYAVATAPGVTMG